MVSFTLGLDYSTQQLKSLLFDEFGQMINEELIRYDHDLGHYGITNGVYVYDESVILAPPAMWVEATDILFGRLSSKFNLGKIVALSGSAQQHTTIFWSNGSSKRLGNFDPEKLLVDQIEDMFSKPLSPTWMDSSTTNECNFMDNFFGGKYATQSRIGSSLACRFSGPQILKAFNNDVRLENCTEAITLVSNGMCSIFAGRLIGMDMSDAAGTGLSKCGSLEWDLDICSAISSNLENTLGRIIPSNSVIGQINDYFVKRYNMNPQCQIVAFTGDNPSSVVGMQLKDGDICLSLGTSDTLFACLSKQPAILPHIPLFVFPHPLLPSTFVTLLCYKNGARARQNICQAICGGSWDKFEHFMNDTIAGNNGIIGLFYDDEEITPPGIRGRFFHNTNSLTDINESDISAPNLVRSLIEGQLLAKYYHFGAISTGGNSGDVSRADPPISRILVTGGASANQAILQVVADVFNGAVYSVDVVNSAALGSVIRAVVATTSRDYSLQFTEKVTRFRLICEPKNAMVYNSLKNSFLDFFNL